MRVIGEALICGAASPLPDIRVPKKTMTTLSGSAVCNMISVTDDKEPQDAKSSLLGTSLAWHKSGRETDDG